MEEEKNPYLASLLHLARCLASLNPAPADKVCGFWHHATALLQIYQFANAAEICLFVDDAKISEHNDLR